jgi:uncharacterized protein (DUF1778 family)
MSIHLHYIFLMKTDTLQIRLQSDEKQAFENAAELAGIALSAWVRERLRSAARRELTDAGHKVPFYRLGAGVADE